jgi:hypothetical protein
MTGSVSRFNDPKYWLPVCFTRRGVPPGPLAR